MQYIENLLSYLKLNFEFHVLKEYRDLLDSDIEFLKNSMGGLDNKNKNLLNKMIKFNGDKSK